MARSKLKNCKVCGAQIAVSAKACPMCGAKNKKPIYKRFWFWLLIIVIVALVMISSGGGESSSSSSSTRKVGEVSRTQTEEPAEDADAEEAPAEDQAPAEEAEAEAAPAEEEAPAAEQQTIFHVGDILQDGDTNIVYMASGVYQGEYFQPAEGMQDIYLEFAYINNSLTDETAISYTSFECYADGYACDMYYGGDDDLSATLSPGRSTSGYIYFEIPVDAQEVEIEYESNWLTEEKITFVYEGEMDSGYVLEKNTAATEGALAVGDVYAGDGLSITYVNCYVDDTAEYETPEAGYHFVTLEFEVENTGDDDQSISYYSFYCYADGIDCESKYFRDDMLDATLSATRKAKGTVTFAVPDDASVVEAEYELNFWTDERVVFSINP